MADGKKIGPAVVGIVLLVGVSALGAWGLNYWWTAARSPQIVILPAAPLPPPAVITNSGSQNPANAPVTGAPNNLTAARPQGTATVDTSGIGARLVGTDAAARDQALQSLRALAAGDPRSMAVGLPKLIQPLLMSGNYKDIEELAHIAILQRPYDMNVVPVVQRGRTLAFLADGNFTQALSEAKSNFNVSSLAGNDEALRIFTQAAAKAAGAAGASAAGGATAASGATAAAGTFDLKSVKILADGDYDSAIALSETNLNKQGKFSYNNLLGRGNLLLLTDHPDDAKTCFQEAAKMSAGNARNIRLAVEGVGRALRASAQDVKAAQTFIDGLADDPSKDGPSMQDGGAPSLDDLRAAAMQVIAQARFR
jgi:hypothetical protein